MTRRGSTQTPILIVAISKNGVIGKKNNIPFNLLTDRLHFKKTTERKIVVVGRKTQESIVKRLGKALPNRKTLVFSRNRGLNTPPECKVVSSVEYVLQIAKQCEVYIAGGEEIYKLFFPHVNKMIITHVLAEVEGDTFFPYVAPNEWRPRLILEQEKDEKNEFPFQIVEYIRGPR